MGLECNLLSSNLGAKFGKDCQYAKVTLQLDGFICTCSCNFMKSKSALIPASPAMWVPGS